MKGGKHSGKGSGPGGAPSFSIWRYLPLFAVLLVGGWLVYLWQHANTLHISMTTTQTGHTPHNIKSMEVYRSSLSSSSSTPGGETSVSSSANQAAMKEMERHQYDKGTPEQLFFQKYFGFSSKSADSSAADSNSASSQVARKIPDHSESVLISGAFNNNARGNALKESTGDGIGQSSTAKDSPTAPAPGASYDGAGKPMPRAQPVLGEIPTNGVKPLYGKKHNGGDAIFALATNYPKLYYERFVGSLRKFGFMDDIVLSVSIPEKMKPGVADYLQKTDCVAYGFDVDCRGKDDCKLKDDFLGYPDPRPYRTFANIRYALYEYWMQYYTDRSYILILDFRDTFFQGNPFSAFGPIAQRVPRYDLKVFEENFKVKNIGKCVFNSLWVGKCFGRAALDALRDKPVLCSGSTLGSYEAIMHYTRTMLQSMDTVQCWKKGIESDQGYQNYLFYNGAFNLNGHNATAYKQGEGIVNTIGALNGHRVPKDMKGPLDTHWHARDKDGWIINYDGSRSACVHQWDRWYGDLVGWIDKTVFDR